MPTSLSWPRQRRPAWRAPAFSEDVSMDISQSAADAFDPVTLEIFWSRLISLADEAAAGLLRTAFSTIVRESNDYASVLMDRNGDSVSENTGGIASFSCILPRTTKTF